MQRRVSWVSLLVMTWKLKDHQSSSFNVKIEILYLEYCEVFKHTVHHVLLWKMFEFENKVDHVFTHRGPVEFVNKPSTFKSGIFGLNFFHHLFTEAANFRGTLNSHIFGALITVKKSLKMICYQRTIYNLRWSYTVKSTSILWCICIEVSPKFY